MKTRLGEFIKVSMLRWIEFSFYTVCGIKFYRNYTRFYWNNKESKQHKPIGGEL
jgi:hypothetical protein